MGRIDRSGMDWLNGPNGTEVEWIDQMDFNGPNRPNKTKLTEVDQMDLIELKRTKVYQIGPKLIKADWSRPNWWSGLKWIACDMLLA